MTNIANRLTQIMKRAQTWPEADQDQAADLLLAIEAERAAAPQLTEADIDALKESAEDVRLNRFANDKSVNEILHRYRR
jgi:hypothetical protein